MTHKHTMLQWNWQDSSKADVRTAHLRANTSQSPPRRSPESGPAAEAVKQTKEFPAVTSAFPLSWNTRQKVDAHSKDSHEIVAIDIFCFPPLFFFFFLHFQMFSFVRSGSNDTSGTWQESQMRVKKSLELSSVVESLVSLLLPSSDQSPGVGIFMGLW